jgi:hypothetical protein
LAAAFFFFFLAFFFCDAYKFHTKLDACVSCRRIPKRRQLPRTLIVVPPGAGLLFTTSDSSSEEASA